MSLLKTQLLKYFGNNQNTQNLRLLRSVLELTFRGKLGNIIQSKLWLWYCCVKPTEEEGANWAQSKSW